MSLPGDHGIMGRGVRILGVRQEINLVKRLLFEERNKVKKVAHNVSADLLRQARDRSPVREGTHIDSMTEHVTDRGYGRGFVIAVSGGDTPYSQWLHEAHYNAHPRSDWVRRTSKRTGNTYYAYAKRFKLYGTSRMKRGGVKVRSDYKLRTFGAGGGFWRDSKGNLHGRKFLDRALRENKAKYITALENAVK